MSSESTQDFIYEFSDRHKAKIFLFTFIAAVILIGLSIVSYIFYKDLWGSAQINGIFSVIKQEMIALSIVGLFYAGFFGSLFFLPLPQELFFIGGVRHGANIYLAVLVIMAGTFLAHLFNYYAGKKFYKFFINFMSKKRFYKMRRTFNKYGGYGVFLFNLLPLPAPLLTFALGFTRYNFFRLFTYLIMGNLLKYFILAFAYKWIFPV